MAYRKNSQLPDPVKHVLPKHAQEIYRKVFNHALEEYKNPDKRDANESKEVVAHKVAWSAVKKKYHKVTDHWERLP